MATEWTSAQLQAMQLHGRDILVSAAAGSGKTATLTERIIRDLKGENGLPPADISRMLIVTFTRAAARELRSRISVALSEAIAQSPDNHHLYRQLLALGSARICTIDAFYQQPVRANFERLGLPPTFRLATESELTPLKRETMTHLLDQFYTTYIPESASEAQPLSVLQGNAFAIAMDDLMPNRDRGKTVDVLLKLHKDLLNFPEGLSSLSYHADRLEAQASLPLHESAEGKVLIAAAIQILTSVSDRIRAALAVFAEDDAALRLYTPQATYDGETVAAALSSLKQNDAEHAIAVLRAYAPTNFGKRTKALQPGEKALAAKELRAIWKKDILSATALFVETPEERTSQMLRTARTERMLFSLLSAYDDAIRERKRSRDIQEFSDVRRALLQLLLDENGKPTDVARDLCDSFDAVYIDEYQDVDTVQDTIFATVGAGGKRFMVGDIKQSIYGFRGAEPAIFADYRRSFTSQPTVQKEGGACLFMSENFRCDRTVIDFTNAVCGYTFGVCEASLGYRPDDDLVAKKRVPEDYTPTPVQVVLLETPSQRDAEDEDEQESDASVNAETAYIAAEIDRLCREETLANGAPIRPRDIAILLRKTTLANALVRALRAYGIETTYAARDPLATHPDMITLVNVLSVIDNPRDDTPLMGLLSSESSPFSLEELLSIRHGCSMDIPLYDALMLAAGEGDGTISSTLSAETVEKCRALIAFVRHWQSIAHALPIDRLLRKLYSEPQFAPKATTPVYLALYESARTYQNNAFCGLYQFLRYFRKLLETSGSLSAGGMDGAEDAVTILTIHKSKGLEFPVVFVGHCASAFTVDDLSAPAVYDHDLGVAARIFCEEDASQRDHIVRRAITTKMRERLVEEEMRLLYVAATRARERLYFTAKLRGSAATPIAAANRPMRGDRTAIMSVSSFVPWILGSLSPANRHGERSDPTAPNAFWRLHVLNSTNYSSLPDAPPTPRIARTDDGQASSVLPACEQPYGSAAFYRAVLREHEGYTDPRALLRTLPTKAAASKLHYDLLDRGFLPDASDDGESAPTAVLAPEDRASESERIRRRIELLQSSHRTFPELLQQRQLANATERGTATHLFLQYCSYQNLHALCAAHTPADAVEQEIERLIREGFLARRDADILNRRHLAAFLESDLFRMVLSAEQSWRELHFNRFLPYTSLTRKQEYAEQLQDASLYVQGSLDLLLQDKDGTLTLCDYKTDRLRHGDTIGERAAPDRKDAVRRQLAADHADQLRIYADAVKALFGKAPDRVLIYSLPLGCTVDLTDEVLAKQ